MNAEPEQKSGNQSRSSEMVRQECPVCGERRVPQYDIELRLAEAALNEWKEIARRLYLARGRRKQEHLRIMAEAAYLKAVADYSPNSDSTTEKR